MKTIFLALFALLFVACNPCKYVARHQECFAPDTIRETNTQTIHDSVTWIVGDTSLFSAWFYCDSMNNVLIRNLDEYKTQGIQTKIIYRDNHLQITTITDSIAKLNRIISNQKTHVEYIKNPVNAQLQKQYLQSEKQLHNRRWLWWWFIGSVIAIAAFVYFHFFK